MKKLDLKQMALLTSNYETRIVLNYKDDNGEQLYLDFKGLSLDDFSYLIDKIPQKTILNFLEGFDEKDVDGLEEYALNKAQKSFTDVFYSVIAAGSGNYDQEEELKSILTTPQSIAAFKAVMQQTLPQNEKELDDMKEAIDKIGADGGKKLKAILNCFKNIVKIMASN